ncbi:hypothetical protein RvY_06100 [Ramazzottius varieornatus]|uniref:NADH dehydrogenase [ubiquinone] 1 alpha subcomplex subunit 2 n=1 Tax=Ramazzottius varieornatus TaxID=947166 RepID=A0A1D1V2W1_RAMVA|nr:hypothetical protein RvY_06100 [Ramazzottius varieornatus]
MAGIRALGAGLKELRIHMCQKSPSSQGARDFMESFYVPLKQRNPELPILVRECSEIEPRLWARYGYGAETSVPLSNMNKESIMQKINEFASGPRMR